MAYLYLIVTVSVLVWLVPPFRHYNRRLFVFFIILALSDPFSLSLLFVFKMETNSFYLFPSLLSLIALFDVETLKKKKAWLFLPLIIAVSVVSAYKTNSAYERFLFLTVHFFIVLRIGYLLAQDLLQTRSISIFYLVLIFYELLILTKFFNILIKVADLTAMTNFYVTTSVQILIGLFFIFYTENDNRIRIRVE